MPSLSSGNGESNVKSSDSTENNGFLQRNKICRPLLGFSYLTNIIQLYFLLNCLRQRGYINVKIMQAYKAYLAPINETSFILSRLIVTCLI